LQDNAFEHFFDEGLITKVIRPIKSGKEASVHLCRANPSTTGETLAALKVFHPPDRRAFRDEGIYRDGEFIKPRRVRVAVEKRTTFGKVVAAAIWVDREWEMLKTLSAAGADVPKPIMRSDRAILMTYIGDEDDAAPQLRSYRPDPDEAEELVRQVIRNVELFLYRNVIHGDLSPYNILVWDGQVTLIDLPQAVDPRKNRHARSFLQRDLERACEWAEAHGLDADADRLTADYWTAWEFADLIPEDLRGLTM
jgi:RIO kinase 1